MRIKEYFISKKPSILISFFLGICFVCSIQASKAQNSYDTINIPASLGLNESQLSTKLDLKTTPNGEIWIALAYDGLLHFDGNNWFTINTKNSNLISDWNYRLHIDANGNLWILNSAGLSSKNGGYVNFPFNATTFPQGQSEITSNATTIFVGGYSGLSLFDIATQSWSILNKNNSILPTNKINVLYSDQTGKVWIGTDQGYAIYENGILSVINSINSSFPIDEVNDIIVTSRDTLFSTNKSGILKLDRGSYLCLDSLYFTKPYENFCDVQNLYSYSYQYKTKYKAKFSLWPNDEIFFLTNSVNSFNKLQILKLDSNGILSNRQFDNDLAYNQSLFTYYKNGSGLLASNDYGFSGIFKIDNKKSFIKLDPIPTYTQNSNYFPSQIPPSYVGGPQTELIGNRVKARILNVGDLHWDPISQISDYQVPYGSNLNSTYCSAIWLGGYDSSDSLYVAAQCYRQNGTDFWPGPLDANGEADSIVSTEFDHIWMANRNDIDAFRYQYALGNVQNGNYTISNFIATWPAYYTAAPNYPQRLAPYVDFNGDNLYNPMDGDYPEIKGDQMAWWVFNDELHHKTETNSPTMKIEIHASAYSLNCNSDSNSIRGLNYTTFYRYTLHNRSNKDYDSCYFAMWSDFDLGNASDDYVGCNIGLNTYYAYNGDSIDEGTYGYGACPPRQNVTFLNAPLTELNDGKDNNHDGQIDEAGEKIGLSGFTYYLGNWSPTGQLGVTDDYYNYISGTWLDNIPITYGGDGRNPGNGNTGIPSPFMFPDSSNTNFSTPWTMENGGIQPTDMRGVGSVGPFNLPAGDSATFDLAFITGPNDKTANENVVRSIIDKFSNGSLFNYHNITTPIKGPQNVTGLNTEQYITSLDTSIYTILWSVQNGSIISGQGTNKINVTWSTNDTGFVNIEVFENGNACKGKESLRVLIGPMNFVGDSSEIIVRMYPNPTIGILNIETTNNSIEQYCIYNLQGQLVKCASYSNLINTDELQSGAYILELRNKSNESLVRKLFIRQ